MRQKKDIKWHTDGKDEIKLILFTDDKIKYKIQINQQREIKAS